MNINELEILRLLNGDASVELESKFNDWINVSEANKAEFKLYETIWKSASHCPKLKEFDLEQEWLAIEDQIKAPETTTYKGGNKIIPINNKLASSFIKNQG